MATKFDNSLQNVIVMENEENEIRAIRNKLIAYYQEKAFEDFTKFVELNESEVAEFKRITNNATLVFTCPSEDTLKADQQSENPRFSKARKFGTTQWYKKTQVVGTALSVLTSYSSYLRYMDSKENEAKRVEKRMDTAATTFAQMTAKEQEEFIARLLATKK